LILAQNHFGKVRVEEKRLPLISLSETVPFSDHGKKFREVKVKIEKCLLQLSAVLFFVVLAVCFAIFLLRKIT